jgi:hypothetical protein
MTIHQGQFFRLHLASQGPLTESGDNLDDGDSCHLVSKGQDTAQYPTVHRIPLLTPAYAHTVKNCPVQSCARQFRPIIPATREVEVGGLQVGGEMWCTTSLVWDRPCV